MFAHSQKIGAPVGDKQDRKPRTTLKWWERSAIALFGVFVMGIGGNFGKPWHLFLLIGGALIIVAGIGLIDVFMALHYRRRNTTTKA